MRRFNYRARDPEGKMVKGNVQAENEQMAGRILVEQGYMPDWIREEGGEGILSKLTNKVTSKDRIVFTRQFATLIGAGLPLSNSLRTVAEQTASKPMKAVIEEVLANVEAGKSLSESFGKHPDVFDNVYLSLIAAGEKSGTLDLALRRLADQEEKNANMLGKIKSAMTYPAIVLVVIIAVIIFMLIVVVPQVEDLYKSLGAELPVATKILVSMAGFVMKYWWLMILIVGILVWGVIQFSVSKKGRRILDRAKLETPLVKGLFLRLYMGRFARTAQMLLSTGVSMLDAIKIASDAINNVVLEEEIAKAAERVRAGKPLSEALKDRNYILPLVPQMSSIGEQSGKIDEMLGKAATVYEDELDEKLAALSTAIEPILMVFLAIVAVGMVAAVLLPIYSLVNDIG